MRKMTHREGSDVPRSQLTDCKPGSTLRQTGYRPRLSLTVSRQEEGPHNKDETGVTPEELGN